MKTHRETSSINIDCDEMHLRQTDKYVDRQKWRYVDRQTDTKTDRQVRRRTDRKYRHKLRLFSVAWSQARQRDRQTDTHVPGRWHWVWRDRTDSRNSCLRMTWPAPGREYQYVYHDVYARLAWCVCVCLNACLRMAWPARGCEYQYVCHDVYVCICIIHTSVNAHASPENQSLHLHIHTHACIHTYAHTHTITYTHTSHSWLTEWIAGKSSMASCQVTYVVSTR